MAADGSNFIPRKNKKTRAGINPALVCLRCQLRLGGELAADQRETGERGAEEEDGGAAIRNGVEREAFGERRGTVRRRIGDLERTGEGGGVKAIAGDRTRENNVQEQGVLGVNRGGDEVERETANDPEVILGAGVEEPRAGLGDSGAIGDGGERTGGRIDDGVVPAESFGGSRDRGGVELNSAAEADVSDDRNGLNGLGESHGDRGHSDYFEDVFHVWFGY